LNLFLQNYIWKNFPQIHPRYFLHRSNVIRLLSSMRYHTKVWASLLLLQATTDVTTLCLLRQIVFRMDSVLEAKNVLFRLWTLMFPSPKGIFSGFAEWLNPWSHSQDLLCYRLRKIEMIKCPYMCLTPDSNSIPQLSLLCTGIEINCVNIVAITPRAS
jgi:hypothetical protein